MWYVLLLILTILLDLSGSDLKVNESFSNRVGDIGLEPMTSRM